VVMSSGVCANIGTHDWVFISVGPLGTQGGTTKVTTASDIRLIPNPNNGAFTIKGTLGSGADEAVNADVTDMLGQVVYRGILQAKRGKLDEQIRLNGTLANGMYILTLRTEQEQKVFHFVMQQ
jgi:hypothetical protein